MAQVNALVLFLFCFAVVNGVHCHRSAFLSDLRIQCDIASCEKYFVFYSIILDLVYPHKTNIGANFAIPKNVLINSLYIFI